MLPSTIHIPMIRLRPNLCALLCLALVMEATSSAVAADAARDQTARETAAKYLDDRLGEWLAWKEARDGGGGGTRCVSCHTTVPLCVARTSVGDASGPEKEMLASIRTRVGKWEQIAAWNGDDTAARPFYSGDNTQKSLATEAVLNALVLVNSDRKRQGGSLGDSSRQALDILWKTQSADGAWKWLNFDLRPWELDAEYYGASLAALAIGKAGPAYAEQIGDADRQRLAKLREYLTTEYPKQSLHNRLHLLWASRSLPGILSPERKTALVDEVLALDADGDGWAATMLGRKPDGNVVWNRVHAIPPDAQYDGYATALVALALKNARDPAPAKLARARMWLLDNRVAEGKGPVIYLNVKRNPDSADVDEAMAGKFLRDAAAAYSVLALSETD